MYHVTDIDKDTLSLIYSHVNGNGMKCKRSAIDQIRFSPVIQGLYCGVYCQPCVFEKRGLGGTRRR